MRKLLVLTSRPLDVDTEEAIALADWRILRAATAREARGIIADEKPLVGLMFVWPEDRQPLNKGYAEVVSAFTGLKWVAALERERMENDACIEMAAEHLFDFLSLPLDMPRLVVILGHAYGMAQVDNRFIELQDHSRVGRFGMIGTSPPMQVFYDDIERAAACDLPVIVFGDPGSGREAAARSIHANSAFAAGPFVVLSCLALQNAVELPGSNGRRPEVPADAFGPGSEPIVEAAGGTLFLDDIAELPLQAQASLMRFLDLRAPDRLGRETQNEVNVRLIASAYEDLEIHVREQRFRSDLFYRLQNLSIRAPSLRERGDDIHALALHFLDKFRLRHESKAQAFHPTTKQALASYEWPGNLRELRNRVQQAALRSRKPLITAVDLGLAQQDADDTPSTLQEARSAAEKQAIASAITRNNNNMTRAAEELRVSRMTLYRLLQKHAIPAPD